MPNDTPQDHLAYVQALFIDNLPALRGFVLSLLSDFTLVDDVVQETFVTVTNRASEFKAGTNFRAWSWTIARYKTLQAIDKRGRANEFLSPDVINALCAHESSRDWHSEELLDKLTACIDELAPRARTAVELRYMQARRPPEVAQMMSWTVEAVNVALSRARIALRECVDRRIAREA